MIGPKNTNDYSANNDDDWPKLTNENGTFFNIPSI